MAGVGGVDSAQIFKSDSMSAANLTSSTSYLASACSGDNGKPDHMISSWSTSGR